MWCQMHWVAWRSTWNIDYILHLSLSHHPFSRGLEVWPLCQLQLSDLSENFLLQWAAGTEPVMQRMLGFLSTRTISYTHKYTLKYCTYTWSFWVFLSVLYWFSVLDSHKHSFIFICVKMVFEINSSVLNCKPWNPSEEKELVQIQFITLIPHHFSSAIYFMYL